MNDQEEQDTRRTELRKLITSGDTIPKAMEALVHCLTATKMRRDPITKGLVEVKDDRTQRLAAKLVRDYTGLTVTPGVPPDRKAKAKLMKWARARV